MIEEEFLRDDVPELVARYRQQPIDEFKNHVAGHAIDTMRKFQYDPMDSSRDKVMRGLGNKILPSSTGGPFLLNENRKKSLKRVYQELTGCVKGFRRELGIPLNNTEPYEWGEIAMDDISDILSDFPQFQLIFDETELPLLDQTPLGKRYLT